MNARRCYTVPLPGASTLQLGHRTLVMGVVNVTPDSFSDGGLCLDTGQAVAHALELEAAGADLLDIGGESTRPGAGPVSVDEELARVVPVLRRLMGVVRVPVSVDTYKAAVARAALDLGVTIVNDVSGLLYEPELADVVASTGAALVLMHTRGRSREMYRDATYTDVGREIAAELAGQMAVAVRAGIDHRQILLDPGLGFAKRAEHSYAALASLGDLARLDRPIVVGPSRKSFLADDERGPSDREWETAAAVTAAVLDGAHVVRVHNVAEAVRVVRVADRIQAHRAGTSAAGAEAVL